MPEQHSRVSDSQSKTEPPPGGGAGGGRAAGAGTGGGRAAAGTAGGRVADAGTPVARAPADDPSLRPAPTHVTLAVVLQVRDDRLCVLLWQRGRPPFSGAWSLPGGYLEPGHTLGESIRSHL